jgi:glutamate synthase (NADPH/NADH) small chain
VQRRVDLLAAEGVTFQTGVQVGNGCPAETLRTEFDAAVLCTGSTKPRDLPIPGRSAFGIHFAMEFLETNTRSLLNSNHHDGNYLSAKDKDVIVIGGGDTGTDCVATALRHGCRSLVQFEILPQPPNGRAADNPWPQWPRVYRLDYGQEEAAAAFGNDPRRYQVMSKQFFSSADNRLTGLQTIDLEWRANNGSGPRPHELDDTEKFWPAQMVLLALGFVGPEKEGLLEHLGIELDARGNVARDENDMTNVAGVFAAGDMARGQSLVVWAIREGRRAARSVDQYLMSESVLD